jgi:RHH-type rel operon transcriptional repressor/antitoxin RelB
MPESTVMDTETGVHLPVELNHRLEELARLEGVSKSALILQAIEKYLEDLEDVSDAEKALEEFYASGDKTITLQEVMKRNGVAY